MSKRGNQSEDPYRAGTSLPQRASWLTVERVTVFVAGLAVVGGLGGGVLGYLIGRLLPGYYRSVFPQGTEPHFDPIAVGIGQGIPQGIAAGVGIALILVAIKAWHEVQLSRASQ